MRPPGQSVSAEHDLLHELRIYDVGVGVGVRVGIGVRTTIGRGVLVGCGVGVGVGVGVLVGVGVGVGVAVGAAHAPMSVVQAPPALGQQ